jgi:acetyl-CoA carboxylase biotin carboxyl carrier protein
MDIARIEEIIEVLEHSTVCELSMRKGSFTVTAKKGTRIAQASAPISVTGADSAQVVAESVEQRHFVVAPMVGIFHFSEGIKKGSHVKEGQVVGAIESMKLLNDVKSDVSGKVVEVLVEDEVPVEYGQPLFRLEPEVKQ